MGNLLWELVREHFQMLDLLFKVKDLGIRSVEGQMKLLEAKSILLAHFKKEHDIFYPALERVSEGDPVLMQTIDSFKKESESILKQSCLFFDKHLLCESEEDFRRDFIRLFLVLSDRVEKEEKTLFTQYASKVRKP